MDKGNLDLFEGFGWLANSKMAKVCYLAICWLFGVSLFVIKLNQIIPRLQLMIPSDGNFCQRLYTYSYNLQGYWLDEGHDRTVLIESDEVYLVQKPHYKLNESVSVPENPLYKWNKFKYLPGLNLEPKLTFSLLKVHKLVREFVFQDTDNKVYFTSNHRWVEFQAKYPTSLMFDH